MANKMISHMAKELLIEQILTDGFEIFEDMGLYFDDEQLDALKDYLNALLENNIAEVEEDGNISINDPDIYNYISKLIELVLSLTFFCFINWAIALFYKNNHPNNSSDE
jgi:hypothetical protein